jgi:hypothetical protein
MYNLIWLLVKWIIKDTFVVIMENNPLDVNEYEIRRELM